MDAKPLTAKTPIAVFVHVHYPNIWESMCSLLAERLAVPFRLMVTTSNDEQSIAIPTTPYLVSSRVMEVENRGRDILPFLRGFAQAEDFEIGLKLHTKKSPQRADGARWLSELLESLLPSPAGVTTLVDKMVSDPRIGFVAPEGFTLPVKPWVLVNADAMRRVMAALDHHLTEVDFADAYFAAGSTFWFRRQALQALTHDCLPVLFEPELGQLDGTIAHGMERLFPIEARRQGYLSLSVGALMESSPEVPIKDMLALAERHAEQTSPLFPSPYVSPPSADFPVFAGKTQVYRLLHALFAKMPTGVQSLVRTARGQLGRSDNLTG